MDPKVYRNDLSEKDEKIPSWLRDFFVQSSITDDIVNSIKNKKQSIENVLKEYRSAIGLDAVEADVEDTIKTASVDEKTPERELEDAKYFAEHSPITFFKSPGYAKYKDIALIAAENLAKQQPAYYFTEKFWKHPEYEKFKLIAAENLLNNFPDIFFRWKFGNIKEYAPLLEEYIKKHRDQFFDFELYLDDEYDKFIPFIIGNNKGLETSFYIRDILKSRNFRIYMPRGVIGHKINVNKPMIEVDAQKFFKSMLHNDDDFFVYLDANNAKKINDKWMVKIDFSVWFNIKETQQDYINFDFNPGSGFILQSIYSGLDIISVSNFNFPKKIISDYMPKEDAMKIFLDWFDNFEKEYAIENIKTSSLCISKPVINLSYTSTTNPKEVKISKEAVMRPLSIRQAKVNVMDMIKKHPDIQNALISLLEHSGGTKSIYAILRFLRDKLGKEYVSYTDQDLMDYIETLKKQFRSVHTDNADANVGRVGMDTDFTDDVADYATQKPSK